MKLFHKAKDERVIAEVNRVYKIGFFLLTAGILVDIVLQAWGVDFRGGQNGRVNQLEFVVVIGAQLICLLLLARRGMMDDNAFAECEHYPWKHYLAQGLLAGAAAAVVVCAMQAGSGAVWASMGIGTILLIFAVQLMFLLPLTVGLVLLFTYLLFRYAKRRRMQAESVDAEEDI